MNDQYQKHFNLIQQQSASSNQNLNDKIESIWVRDYKEIKDSNTYMNSGHYEFMIQTKFKGSNQCIEVCRRYSEIEKLHNYIKFNSKGGFIPPMPAKSYSITDLLIWSEFSLKQRQEDMNKFFQDLVQQNHNDSERVIEHFFSIQNYQILDLLIDLLENKNSNLDLNKFWSVQLMNQNCFSQDTDELLKEMTNEKYFQQLTSNIKNINNIECILQKLTSFIDSDQEIQKEIQAEFERVNLYFNEKNLKSDDKLKIFVQKFENTGSYQNDQLKYNIETLLRRIKQAKNGYQELIENLKNKKKLIQFQNLNNNYIQNESFIIKSQQILKYQDQLIQNFELQFDNFNKILQNDYENLQKQFGHSQFKKYDINI